jgi:hypothetical protein
LSRKDFVFVWDEETLTWVADKDTRDRRRESQSVPADIETAIEGVRRKRQGSKIFLFVPMSEQEELYNLVPSFRPGKEITRRVAEKGIDIAKEAIKKTAATQTTRPELPTSVRAGQKIGELFKDAEDQEVGSSLPGLPRTKPAEEKQPSSTAFITDKAQAAEERRFATQAFGLRPKINLPPNSRVLGDGSGVFDVNGEKQLFTYDRNTDTLQPQSLQAFNYGLFSLKPDAISEYKKGLGYKAEDVNGVLTDKFKSDMLDIAKAVSEYSYGYSQSGLKKPIDLIQYLSTPEAYPEIGSMIKQQKSGGGGPKIDPNKLAANVDTVKLLETELGVSLSKEQRNKIARDLATGRVNSTTLPSTIAQVGKLSLDEGEAASLKAELKQNAAINGVDLDEAWFDRTTQDILQGKMARETANTEILKQAKLKYAAPSVVAGLDAGFSVRDQASQYINWIAQVRGVDPKTISLDDPIISKAFTNRNNEGMAVQMSLYDWQDWAKQNDPTYAYSSMAEESYVSTLRAIGQAFGKSI